VSTPAPSESGIPDRDASSSLVLNASLEQQRVIERITAQRERLQARRAARAQTLALAAQTQANGGDADSFALRALAFARQHPIAVAALAGAGAMVGPRRLLRWGGVLLPLIMRFRR
jgi:hypothetical protein